jgi:hypothetical protein
VTFATRVPLAAALLMAFAALPAGAQTATSTAGGVGSAALRNGYPVGGGAIALPARSASESAATATAAGTAANSAGAAASGGAGSSAAGSGGSGGGRSAAGLASGGASGAARSSSRGHGGHWVLCPPGGEGLAPLLTGTDLSCAPD